MAELKEHPKHQGGYCKGDKIYFYYIPDEHRVQYAEPPMYKDFVQLVPKFKLDELKQKIKDLANE